MPCYCCAEHKKPDKITTCYSKYICCFKIYLKKFFAFSTAFAGILSALPAFAGMNGEIFTVRFKALASGTAGLTFTDFKFLYADGKGTPTNVILTPATITITKNTEQKKDGALQNAYPEDTNAPTLEYVSITQSPVDSARLLTFSAQDGESGVRGVSVREKLLLLWTKWRAVENPVRLSALATVAELRASDNAGNTAIALINAGITPTLLLTLMFLTAGIGIFLLVLIKRKKKE